MPATRPPVSAETLNAARDSVRKLLEGSDAYNQLPEERRKALAHDLVQVGAFLAEPGMRVPAQHMSPEVRALADTGSTSARDQPKFGQAVSTGVEQAVALIEGVNFPAFVSGLIEGVFHSIVKSSLEQMEAYGKLVADVSKSLNQFRDDNTTANQAATTWSSSSRTCSSCSCPAPTTRSRVSATRRRPARGWRCAKGWTNARRSRA